MKLNYFDEEKADENDIQLQMSIQQGYVPSTCRLGGVVVLSEVNNGRDPCAGCEGPRHICEGRPKAGAVIYDKPPPEIEKPMKPMKIIMDDPPMWEHSL